MSSYYGYTLNPDAPPARQVKPRELVYKEPMSGFRSDETIIFEGRKVVARKFVRWPTCSKCHVDKNLEIDTVGREAAVFLVCPKC